MFGMIHLMGGFKALSVTLSFKYAFPDRQKGNRVKRRMHIGACKLGLYVLKHTERFCWGGPSSDVFDSCGDNCFGSVLLCICKLGYGNVFQFLDTVMVYENALHRIYGESLIRPLLSCHPLLSPLGVKPASSLSLQGMRIQHSASPIEV